MLCITDRECSGFYRGYNFGTGLFTSLGAATVHALSGLIFAMLIGRLIILLTGISEAQVGVNYPVERFLGCAFLGIILSVRYKRSA